MQLADDAVRPAFNRRSTKLESMVRKFVVPGINAVLDAGKFSGGIEGAGSDSTSASNVIDGRTDSYWEPDSNDLLENGGWRSTWAAPRAVGARNQFRSTRGSINESRLRRQLDEPRLVDLPSHVPVPRHICHNLSAVLRAVKLKASLASATGAFASWLLSK